MPLLATIRFLEQKHDSKMLVKIEFVELVTMEAHHLD